MYPVPESLVEVFPGSGKLKISGTSSSGTRLAKVSGSDLLAALRYLLPVVTIDSEGKEHRFGGDAFPNFPMLTVSEVTAEPSGAQSGEWEWSGNPLHSSYKLNITYSPQEQFQKEQDTPEGEDVLIIGVDYSVDLLSVPVRIPQTGSPSDKGRAVKHIRLPKVVYTLELPKVIKPKWSVINEASGTINSVAVMGCEIGTLLFDGPKLRTAINTVEPASWKVQYKFVYNKYGWNKSLNPDTLDWETVQAETGGNLPYEEYDIRNLWTE